MMVLNSSDITQALSLRANFLVYGVDSFLIRDAASRAVDTFSYELDKISTRKETEPKNKESL